MIDNKDKKRDTEDIYEELLESQISYIIDEDPLESYTHLTKEEKARVKEYILDDTYLWDFAPVAEFIYNNIPTTFLEHNFKRLGITFDPEKFKNEAYDEDIRYTLYQHYLLDFEYGIGNTPVSYDEFINNELQSEDYLTMIDGLEI